MRKPDEVAELRAEMLARQMALESAFYATLAALTRDDSMRREKVQFAIAATEAVIREKIKAGDPDQRRIAREAEVHWLGLRHLMEGVANMPNAGS